MYHVYRQINGSGEFAFLGTSGKKRFVDATLPAGARMVMYKIRAVRSTAVGESATFNVNFGVSSGRMTTARVEEMRKAA